jgi:hypothetical protein
MVLVLRVLAVVVYTYCGAARAAGRSERDDAVATRVRGLSDRDKEAILQYWIGVEEKNVACHSHQRRWTAAAAHKPRQLKVSRRRPHHACHVSGVCGERPSHVSRHRHISTTQHQVVESVLQTRYYGIALVDREQRKGI